MLTTENLLTDLTIDQLKLVTNLKKIKGGTAATRPLTGFYARARPLTGIGMGAVL
ncbi:MAG: hypothetical protein AAGG75_05140 [Bacteroidota bacterium]